MFHCFKYFYKNICFRENWKKMYTRDSLQREARASECFLQRAREKTLPYPTSYARYCFKFDRTLSHSSGERAARCRERWRACIRVRLLEGTSGVFLFFQNFFFFENCPINIHFVHENRHAIFDKIKFFLSPANFLKNEDIQLLFAEILHYTDDFWHGSSFMAWIITPTIS